MFDTLLDVLAFQAEMRPTMLFAKDDQQSLTHREAWLRIGQIAARLQASGVQREDRVGILCKNSVDNLLLFLGCGAAGVVP
ncbi:MAG: AMP-binding protein, partial [Spongiibacter sp.]|nr:AMP-binding protein [Spongiibacter sp.]